MAEIDWSKHDKYSESKCSCVCGQVYRSHAKFVMNLGLVARKACPRCGKNILNRASSDPEQMTIGAEDVERERIKRELEPEAPDEGIQEDDDAVTRLGKILKRTGMKVTFDPGRNNTHPCTFCAKKAEPTHELLVIGTYPNGDAIERPVCVDCKPIVEPTEGT